VIEPHHLHGSNRSIGREGALGPVVIGAAVLLWVGQLAVWRSSPPPAVPVVIVGLCWLAAAAVIIWLLFVRYLL